MRDRFCELIRREIEHAEAGRPMRHQGQDEPAPGSVVWFGSSMRRAGRGCPCRSTCVVCAFSSPVFKGSPRPSRSSRFSADFLNTGGSTDSKTAVNPRSIIGSADWMKRNLDRRVETMAPVTDSALKAEIDVILGVLENDNNTAWDLQIRRHAMSGGDRRKGNRLARRSRSSSGSRRQARVLNSKF